ncbi:peptidase domain-containing ABC transporter [Nitratireductor aquimarinus]|uniref:peptidase domain-containing ABC transporter n=1 Tax=Nitratireductor TaxID=245876 RepID=UPI0019D34A53|nr:MULTISPECIES: peptidase domain-containing ABC transporter [Nitratireductor]MBN7776748.1 peptidase domain-containing ABC transporter [Nitratireductor pacificus]MBN7780082.1 peptidase domain-containing ABC transporter [Nitratireductor pacificus]MBN7788889.1 peptidase domain-containing ABC transporter [Nitratireductor aquimarinus]MBY6098957.1 peptidase domain-containing ABC transporter [Nitratireductor aquimarinus]MCA1259383.1 peptidase domain-containing ABC transporter [Nitratireductor aquima
MTPNTSLPGQGVPLSWFSTTLRKHSLLYVELTFLAICVRLIGLLEPFVFQVVIDRILPFQREASLIVVIVVLIGANLFSLGFNLLAAFLGVSVANRLTSELGRRLFDHLFRLPLRHFRRWPVGETLSRIGETDTIRGFLIGVTTGASLDLLFIGVYFMVLLSISGKLTMVVAFAVPLQALLYMCFGPVLRKRLRAQFDAGSHHQARMVENLSGMTAVKALTAEGAMLSRLSETLAQTLNASRRVYTMNAVSGQLIGLCEKGIFIGVIYIGAQQVFAGELTLGQLIAFQLIAEKIAAPIAGFSKLWQDWQNLRISRQRLGDILNSEQEKFGSGSVFPDDIEPRLAFQGVSFGYGPDEPPVISGLDLSLEPRTCTLVVGPSGIGKSTFGRLAAGLEEPQSGIITVGGQDLAAFEPESLRCRVVYVPQEPYLFSGTLRENLLLRTPDASDAEILDALRISAAGELVFRLAQGLDTEVGERGSALSGGQKQRVAIARAILQKPAILILDEPISALDEAAQCRLVSQLMQLKKQLTVIVITHRPDVFVGADSVIDFGTGRL